MDSKGGNPFLMDDYPAEPPAQASNPFLQDFAEPTVPSSGENPFLNFTTTTTYQPPTDSTNPFAFYEPTQDTQQYTTAPLTTAADQLVTQETNLVDADSTQSDFFGAETIVSPQVSPPVPVAFTPIQPITVVPTTNVSPIVPKRPPPPARPGPPPPPRNTKDLILSVTGTMDATSNHLLDRLQATRTPSPTLMHSPSPTPEHSFADLLDVDSNVPDLIADDNRSAEPGKTMNILDLFDAPTSDMTAAMGIDSVNQPVTTTDTMFTSEVSAVAEAQQDNPFGIGHEESAVDAVPIVYEDESTALAADVASSKRSSIDIPTDAVSDFDFADLTSQHTEPLSSTVESNFFSMEEKIEQQDITMSPFPNTHNNLFDAEPLETAQAPTDNVFASDLLGDFSKTDQINDFVATSPTVASAFPETAMYTPEKLDNFAATTQAIQNTGDAFDSFADKFDKAAEPEAASDSFFDAFGSTGQTAMDTSSDVWGDSSVGGSEGAVAGFGESDGFDSFLSMTAPPQETTTKIKRTDSGDSDEAPDFSVFIKPKEGGDGISEGGPVPVLAPPPRSPLNSAYNDSSPRFNPFDKSGGLAQEALTIPTEAIATAELTRTDSQVSHV